MPAAALMLAAPLIAQGIKSGISIGSGARHAARIKKEKAKIDRDMAGPTKISPEDDARIAQGRSAYAERVQQLLSRGGNITGAGPTGTGAEAARQAGVIAGQEKGEAYKAEQAKKDLLRVRSSELQSEWIDARKSLGKAVGTGLSEMAKLAPEAKAVGEKLREQKEQKLALSQLAAKGNLDSMKQKTNSFSRAGHSGIFSAGAGAGAGGWDDWTNVFGR